MRWALLLSFLLIPSPALEHAGDDDQSLLPELEAARANRGKAQAAWEETKQQLALAQQQRGASERMRQEMLEIKRTNALLRKSLRRAEEIF